MSTKLGKHVEIKKFAKKFVENGGNATEAVLATGKKLKRSSARRRGSDLLKREEVKEEIRKALKQNQINYDYIIKTRKEVVDKGIEQLNGSVVTPKDVHSHLQGLENIISRLESRSNNTASSVHLHLHEKSQRELLEHRQKLNSWFTDIIEGDST